MRNQQPEMSPHPRQQPISREKQLLPQHLMYKQLQEHQKQQQLQQLNQEVMQSDLLNQAAARQGVVNQLPALLNSMSVNDASNYMVSNNIMGGESKTPSNPQMLIAGNMNWAQGRGPPVMHGSNGFMISNDHGQAMRSMGLVSQQIDQSLYGTPVSNRGGLLDQYSQFRSSMFTDMMTKSGENQLEKTSRQTTPSNSFHNDQRVPAQAYLQAGRSTAQCFQGRSLSGASETFQQVNHPHNVQIQEVHGRERQAAWSADLEEKEATLLRPSHGATSLDPTEEKILFGSDDGNWSASLGGILHGNPLETNDQLSAFPSIQSGSWSALMQEAVQASSSDRGFQEEWSGLSFEKTEPSSMNHSAVANDNGKQHAAYNNNNNNSLQGASSTTLRGFPLFNVAAGNSSFPSDHSFEHSVRTTYEQSDQRQTDASHGSFQQSSKDVQGIHFSQSPKQNKFVDGGFEAQMQLNDIPDGVWSREMKEQSFKSTHSKGAEYNSQKNRHIWLHQQHAPFSTVASQTSATPDGWNRSMTSSGGSSLEVPGNDGRMPYAHNEVKSISNINQDMNHHVLNRHQVDLMKQAAFDSFLKSRGENVEKYQHQPSGGQHDQDSAMNDIDRSPSISDSQTSSGLSGWKNVGSRRSLHQQHVNSGMNSEPVDSAKDSQSVIKDSQRQGYLRRSQLAGLGVSNAAKGHSTELQRSINGSEEMQLTMHKHDSPSSADFALNTIKCQTSQNMLELLHKVDQSRDSNTLPGFDNSNCSALHDTYESAVSVGSDFHPQHHLTSAFQGFGLGLAPLPRQQSDKTLHPSQDASQREIQDSRSDLSGEAHKQVLHSVAEGNSSAVTASDLRYIAQQLQLQQKQHFLQQQRVSNVAGSQSESDEHARHVSFLRQAQDSHDQATNQSAQKPLPNMAGRLLPFRGGIGPVLQASNASNIPQQIGFPTMLHNAWTNASVQQPISGLHSSKHNTDVPQSVILGSSCRVLESAAVQEHDQVSKGENLPSALASCSNKAQLANEEGNPIKDNSLRRSPSEKGDFRGCHLEDQKQVSKHHLDGGSTSPISTMEHFPHRDANKAKHGHESFLNSQAEQCSIPNMDLPNSNIGIYGHNMIPSDVQHANYLLLQQMQAIKGADFDVIKMAGKRLKGDFSADASQGYIYGQNEVKRIPADGEAISTCHNSFSPDVKMVSFSSRENEEKFPGGTSQLVGRGLPSQNVQLQTQPLCSTSNNMRRIEQSQISPQMARSWFEHYTKYKNGQILAMFDNQRNANTAPQHGISAEVAEQMCSDPLVEQRVESSQFASPGHSTSPHAIVASELSPQLPLDIIDHTFMTSKKRKIATMEILPWHQEVVQGIQRLQSISSAERDWAQTTNRLPEKVEDEAELTEDATLVSRARRRLILTTQLIQQLLPPVPTPILAAEVASTYEHVTYFLAKSALGCACSLISCSGSDSREHLDSGNRILAKGRTVGRTSEDFFSNIVEGFIGRSRTLEHDLLRLDKRTSVLDARLECQELERFSLVNRLGKFHGRSQADGAVGSSSTSQKVDRKLLPQRYVTLLSVPGNLPEGVICLSL
ncbi:uncharacterized protein M6B38_397105 [Iris pallida]|uniref:Uncharacterized protein n=1 Tax=Iris pallida TaxID=29817 RepID=A0AAX6FVM0_IRIPA|nr:uncharacterized protein M6B38_397105 [Iris pallida]